MPVTISNAATPRRYTPPSPSPGANDLTEFFGSPLKEWYGVRIERLASNVTVNEVKTMFLFSVGFEDLRIIRNDQVFKGPYAEAYVRLQNKECADEAERLLNNKDFNGTSIAVTVVPRPTLSEIVKMATSMEIFATDFSSQSPSSSDGLITPATIGTQSLGEYTTAGSRHIASPVNNGHTTANGAIGTGLGNDFLPMNGITGNRPATSGVELYSAMTAAIERLNVNDKANGMNVLGGSSGYENAYLTENYLDNLAQQNRHGALHQTLDEHDSAVGDGYSDPLSNFPRPRRQTNPAQSTTGSRFGALPPLSTMGVNGFSKTGITSPLTAPPVAAPGLTSPMSPNGWPSSGVNRYPAFPISHPPANPADQNPPCNTLYVGNLPAQTSEDELKTMFVRQRGYKRMCFRTKPQGPMCFVEFEDTHYATKALTELYGRALSNSTKGGVRLSFSKNPLGVRSQPSNGSNSPSAPRGNSAIPGPAGVPAHGLPTTALRTPPGLSNQARQMTSLTTSTSTEQSTPPPPGLFNSGSSSQQLREQSSTGGQPTGVPPGLFNPGSSSQPLRDQSSTGGQSSGPPPGLFNSGSSSQLLRDQSNASHSAFMGQITSRMPPGISTSGNTAFYAGTTPDVRSPMDNLRSPVGDLYSSGPGAIGTR
ncbi:hypothetical protein BDD12DRAFT_874864 [Trichophaea hybrida]|nr:hypothetical protein BDD12DRAFT_874864 [Trichophaea hybrida]